KHAINLHMSAAARLKHNVPPVRRPRWEVVASSIVGQWHLLFAGDVHHIDVARPRLTRPVVPHPGKGQELSIWRPRRRHGITLVGYAYGVRSIRCHGIDLG